MTDKMTDESGQEANTMQLSEKQINAFWSKVTVTKEGSILGLNDGITAALSAAEPVRWTWEERRFAESDIWDDMYDDDPPAPHKHVRNIRPLYAAPPAPSVAVKALDWKAHDDGINHIAIGAFGMDVAYVATGEGWRRFSEKWVALDGLDASKAAAQADYEVRIRSALSAQVQDVAETEADIVERMVKSVADPFPSVNLNVSRGIDGWRELMRDALRAAAPAKQG